MVDILAVINLTPDVNNRKEPERTVQKMDDWNKVNK